MNTRAAVWLAWSLWVLYVAVAVPMVALVTANDAALRSDIPVATLLHALWGAIVLLVMMTVGALVAAQRPQNPIGWLFCCVALASESGTLGIEYAVYTLKTAPGSLPAGVWIGLYGDWARSIGWFLLLTFLLLLFPNGRLLTPRWRPVAWLSGAFLTLYSAVALLVPDAFANADVRLADVRNPIAITQHSTVMGLLEMGSIILMFASTVACGASVSSRFRRARGMERQQLKWFVYAVVCGLILFACIVVAMFLPGSPGVLGEGFDVILVALPIATGIAILRHRLFDIDLIIRRTLLYGSLTALLAAIYFGSVLAMQQAVPLVSGQSAGQNPFVIVLSTLLIAALFQPLRRRMQNVIDHRFYRRKYDAARTIAAFSATLRQEVDLDELRANLIAVVDETMQPAQVSLWLRPAERNDYVRAGR